MPELNENSSRRAAEQVCQKALGRKSAEERIRWALETLPGTHMLSSSFGAQSAVMLHLLTRQVPDIPVVVIDTGNLFAETYRFIDELTERLDLNLKVYRPERSSAWQEALYGRRWEQGVEGLAAYNRENKVLPMERALEELGVGYLVRRPAAPAVDGTRPHAVHRCLWRTLEGASNRRLVRPRRVPVPEKIRPAVSPVVGEGLRVDRRRPYDALAGGC